MSTTRSISAAFVVAVSCASILSAQDGHGDAAAMTQFQRGVDSYAFLHRQVQHRLGVTADRNAMAAGLRAARPSAADGDYFTPIIAAAFRNRIAIAARTQGCRIAASDTMSSEVPRLGDLAIATQAIPGCLLSVLPRLPEELEYRAAGVALILVDTHANVVVDVLHGAFPASHD
jgi:hypothetical protein